MVDCDICEVEILDEVVVGYVVLVSSGVDVLDLEMMEVVFVFVMVLV